MPSAKLNPLVEETQEMDPMNLLSSSSKRFDMHGLSQSLKDIVPGPAQHPPRYLSGAQDFDLDNEELDKPTTRKKARESVDGVNDMNKAVRRLARCHDVSEDHLRGEINELQHSNVQRFNYIEQQIVDSNQQILSAIHSLSERVSQSSSPRSVAETTVPLLQQKQPAYRPPQRRTATEFRNLGLNLGTHHYNGSDDDDDEARGPRFHRGGANQRNRDRSVSRNPPWLQPNVPPKPPALQDGPVATKNSTEFKVQEIGYFYPGLGVSRENPEGPFINVGKDLIYRDVHMFVQQARRIARNKPNIVSYLHFCFRGSAITWFSSLKESLQDAMADDVNLFCDRLVDKFKLSHSRAFDKLHAERYTMDDAKKTRPADEYIQSMLLYGQACDQSTTAVLVLAWKNLDREIQRDVRRPRGDPDEFARDLDDAAEYWASSPASKRSTVSTTAVAISGNSDRFDRSDRYDEKEAAFQRGVRSAERRLLGDQNQQGQPNQQYQSQKPQQQIRSQQGSQYQNSQYQANSQQKPYHTTILPPPVPPNRRITANHVDDNRDEYSDEHQEDHEHHQEMEYANFGDTEIAYNSGNHVFFNDGDYARHGDPPHSCNLCRIAFTNIDEIDHHMLSFHAIDTKSPTSLGYKRYANWLEHAALHIVTIKEPEPSRGYATIQGQLFENKDQQSLCIDTGSGTTFIDDSLLPQGLARFGMIHKTLPITVRGITGERIVDQIIHLPIFITGNSGKKICINARAYVTKGIRAGVILGMDELGRPDDDIALWLGRRVMQIQGTDVPINFTPPGSKPVAFFSDTEFAIKCVDNNFTRCNVVDVATKKSCLKKSQSPNTKSKPPRKSVHFWPSATDFITNSKFGSLVKQVFKIHGRNSGVPTLSTRIDEKSRPPQEHHHQMDFRQTKHAPYVI